MRLSEEPGENMKGERFGHTPESMELFSVCVHTACHTLRAHCHTDAILLAYPLLFFAADQSGSGEGVPSR